MDETVVVHEVEAFQHLSRDLPRFRLRERSAQVFLQVAMLNVFHRDVNRISLLKPSVGSHKTVGILPSA